MSLIGLKPSTETLVLSSGGVRTALGVGRCSLKTSDPDTEKGLLRYLCWPLTAAASVPEEKGQPQVAGQGQAQP